MKNENEWSQLSELLSHLIVKYADDLDIDAMPKPNMPLQDANTADALKKNAAEPIAKDIVA